MDFGLAFSYVFKDKEWLKKIAIIGLVGLIPIVGPLVVFGWMMDVTKRVMNNELNPLPDLDFGADLSRGFMGFVVSFVYSLPVTLLAIFSGFFSALVSDSGSRAGAGIAGLFSFLIGLLMILLGLFIGLLLPAAIAKYLENGQLGDAFNFGEVFKMVTNNLSAYIVVWLGTLVAGLIAPLGFLVFLIGAILTYTYYMAVVGHFYGQAYNVATKGKVVVEIPSTLA